MEHDVAAVDELAERRVDEILLNEREARVFAHSVQV